MKSLKKTSFVITFFVLISCYESLDFEQLEDYVYKPIFTSALTYFSVTPSQFFSSSGVQEYEITHVADFEAFQRSFVESSVVKFDFNAILKNELDRDVTINFEFLDDSMNLLYTAKSIVVESNDIDPPPYLEEIIIADNQHILKTRFVRVKASIEDTGSPLDPNATTEFEFKSSVTLYVKSEL